MDIFKMCSYCGSENKNPTERSVHAQANCELALRLFTNEGKDLLCHDPIRKTIALLQEGKIIAIKGLGGFHLTCDAQNQEVIKLLRERKNRPHKPFAVMVGEIEAAKKVCFMDEIEEEILISKRRPIVLLEKKENSILPNLVAPNMKRLGIMLPYTPLHYLLFQKGIFSLVVTSANRSSSPIEYEDLQAIKNLGMIADYFLIHNRKIPFPMEDSVVKVVKRREVVVRKARGYTPSIMPLEADFEILALGAEEKSTFCLTQRNNIFMSQYLGDLKNYDTYLIYEKAIKKITDQLGFIPEIRVHDLNGSYLSTHYAQHQIGRKVAVQHHHAHMASCMVEHNLFTPTIGVIFDGTGLGTDGKIWGGEFFVGTRKSFFRAGHFRYVTIQGGDQAIREPWRIAASYLHSLNCEYSNIFSEIDKASLKTVKQALDKNLNCYQTSSVGRLFDCVAALLKIRQRITYDAQAAIELENIIDPSIEEGYPFYIEKQNQIYQIDHREMLFSILKDINSGLSPAWISAKFHNTIGNATVDLVMRIGERYGLKKVVLSGGVFENSYLLCQIIEKLEERDFAVYFNQQIPTNDSGISVGQLAIVAAKEERA